MKKNKVVIVGTGMVGMSYAYSMVNQGTCEELVLIDIDKNRAQGEAIDLNHGLSFAPRKMNIYAGDYSDCKDAYFIGFTPDVVTGVWVGNDDNSKMGELTGGTVPAIIWKEIMIVATAPYGNSDFEYPEIILNPFKAKTVTVISQSDAKKAWEEEEERLKKEKEMENEPIKPDSIKPAELFPQAFTNMKKKEKEASKEESKVKEPNEPKEIKEKEVKTIEVKEERAEAAADLAPIPMEPVILGE